MSKYVMIPFENTTEARIFVDKLVHNAYDTYCREGIDNLNEFILKLHGIQSSANTIFNYEQEEIAKVMADATT